VWVVNSGHQPVPPPHPPCCLGGGVTRNDTGACNHERWRRGEVPLAELRQLLLERGDRREAIAVLGDAREHVVGREHEVVRVA
jgi:hypothetical protein